MEESLTQKQLSSFFSSKESSLSQQYRTLQTKMECHNGVIELL